MELKDGILFLEWYLLVLISLDVLLPSVVFSLLTY